MKRYFRDATVEALIRWAEVVIFDLNGLVIDDEPLQLAATNEALKGSGITISEEDWIAKCVGHKPLEYLPQLVAGSAEPEEIVALKDRIYRDLIGDSVSQIVRPGVLDLMQHLQKLGRPMAIATSTTRTGVDVILRGLPELARMVSGVVCGDEVKKSKPDPEIYIKAARKYSASRFLAVEDSSVGLSAAKRAQMRCLVVPNRFTVEQDFSEADAVVDGFAPNAMPVRRSER